MSYDTALTLLTTSTLPYTLHEHVVSQTVADAGEKLNFPLERLLKTIVFKDKAGRYYLVAVRGPDQIDYRKLADATGVKRAELAQVSPAEITEVFGVEVGSVGPLLSQTGTVVFFDA
jgi:Cys-tRNA(Pro)/Cys-tRNA(Cys) deacylase